MTEQLNFPGARRTDMYVENEEQPVIAAVPAESPEEPAVEDFEPFVDPADLATESGGKAEPAAAVKPAAAARRKAETTEPPKEEKPTVEPVAPAEMGFSGWLNRVFGGMFNLAPSAAEVAARTEAAEEELEALELAANQARFEDLIRQSSWTRAVGMLVANKKGTAGKTPLSILLGGVLAAIRGGSVAILEVADDKGQLAYRSEGEPRLGIGELVANISTIATNAQLSGYTVKQKSFASVIGSTATWRPPLTRENVLDVSAVVDKNYTIRVMDTGNQYSSSAFSGAIEVSDILVIPTMLAQDAVSEAVELLEFLENQGPDAAQLARTAIVVMMSDGRPELKASLLKKQFTDKGIPEDHIYSVPYDAHVAERGEITLGKVSTTTRQALTAIAAGVIAQTNQNVFEKEQNR